MLAFVIVTFCCYCSVFVHAICVYVIGWMSVHVKTTCGKCIIGYMRIYSFLVNHSASSVTDILGLVCFPPLAEAVANDKEVKSFEVSSLSSPTSDSCFDSESG